MSNEVLSTALKWLSAGIVPIPLREKSKLPRFRWSVWQREFPDEKLVKVWFKNPDTNIGLVCGGPKHLVVLDFDLLSAYYAWKARMMERDDIWYYVAENGYLVSSARGVHVYLKTDELETSAKLPDQHVDIKSCGGYVVAPPSIHPNGSRYIDKGGIIYAVKSVYDVFTRPVMVYTQKPKPAVMTELDLARDDGNDFYKLIKAVKESISVLQFSQMNTPMMPTCDDKRWWMGRCINPLHEDKIPSYRVDTLNNRAQCLSSRCILSAKSYDVIDLYAVINNMTQKDATYTLAKMIGVETC